MKHLILLLLHFLGYLNSFSQNLISNYSFEDTIPCNTNPFLGSVETAPPWTMYCQSSDFHSIDYCGGQFIGFGYQIPKSGNSFAGTGVYNPFVIPGFREVFGQELNDTLIYGHTYCVSFYVSLAEFSKFAIDKIGALFTSFPIDGSYVFSYTANPQIINPPNNILMDTLNWMQVSGSFVSNGTEKFIAVGNFFADGNFQLDSVQWPWTAPMAYYYIDDISVIDCTVGSNELNWPTINVFPNFTNSMITIDAPEYVNLEFNLFDNTSRMINTYALNGLNQLDISHINSGIYFYQIIDNSKTLIKTGKLLKY